MYKLITIVLLASSFLFVPSLEAGVTFGIRVGGGSYYHRYHYPYYYNDRYCSGYHRGGHCAVPMRGQFHGYRFYRDGVYFYYDRDYYHRNYRYNSYYYTYPPGYNRGYYYSYPGFGIYFSNKKHYRYGNKHKGNRYHNRKGHRGHRGGHGGRGDGGGRRGGR